MIYLDSSALMKLVRREDETTALRDWLNHYPEQAVVTSELGRVEVLRAARRLGLARSSAISQSPAGCAQPGVATTRPAPLAASTIR